MSKADRLTSWREASILRAASARGLADGYEQEASHTNCSDDDARVLRGQALAARVRARASDEETKVYECLLAGGDGTSTGSIPDVSALQTWAETAKRPYRGALLALCTRVRELERERDAYRDGGVAALSIEIARRDEALRELAQTLEKKS